MDLLQQFKTHWQQQYNQLSITNCHLLLAVSGGVDSTVLVDVVAKSGFDFSLVHCNFKLRGAESERDENFVQQLAQQYAKKISIKHFDTTTYITENKIGVQEAARNLRYNWFNQILQTSNAALPTFIVTAHHADDNIETVLMNIFRGTGMQGLTGIPSVDKKNKLIRPLLFATRKDILDYANANQLQWVEDSSNEKDNYTRNFFRHQIIPLIQEKFTNANNNLLNNIERWKDAETLYQQSIQQHLKKLLIKNGNEFQIPILLLKKTAATKTIVWEIIQDFGFTSAQTDEIIKLMDADNGSYIQSVTHQIFKNRQWLIVAPIKTEIAQHIIIEAIDKKIVFENGELAFKIIQSINNEIPSSASTALLDVAEIKFPLLLRKCKQGDYFYPLGMKKKKKISRFLIDLKLSKTEKVKVWVIEMNKKIVWVVGYRIDERFKITSNTQEVLQLTLNKVVPAQ